jgi:hypothetical protein
MIRPSHPSKGKGDEAMIHPLRKSKERSDEAMIHCYPFQ